MNSSVTSNVRFAPTTETVSSATVQDELTRIRTTMLGEH